MLFDAGEGLRGCFILFATRYTLKYLRNTDSVKELARALADARQFDIIIDKLSQFIGENQVNSFVEALIENGIDKIVPTWAR